MNDCSIVESSDSLAIIRPRRDGCVFLFLLVWLPVWTYGFFRLLTGEWTASNWTGIAIVGSVEAAALGILVHSLTGQQRLTFDRRDIVYEASAIVVFHRRTLPIVGVTSVDLLPLDPTRRRDRAVGELVIASSDGDIRFGAGLSGKELHDLLSLVRRQVEKHRVALTPAESAGTVAPISHAQQEKLNEQDEATSAWAQVGRWLTVPFFIAGGCLFLYGGGVAILSGHPIAVVAGLVFTCIGLLLTVGLTWASLAVLRDWLRNRKGKER